MKDIFSIYQAFIDSIPCCTINCPSTEVKFTSTLDALVETVLNKVTTFITLQTSGSNGGLSEWSAVSDSTISLESHGWISISSDDLSAFNLSATQFLPQLFNRRDASLSLISFLLIQWLSKLYSPLGSLIHFQENHFNRPITRAKTNSVLRINTFILLPATPSSWHFLYLYWHEYSLILLWQMQLNWSALLAQLMPSEFTP